MNKIILKPHQKEQLKKEVKLECINESYAEYFSLSRFNKCLDELLLDFINKSNPQESFYSVSIYDLLPRYKIEALSCGKHIEYDNSDNYFTIPKTVFGYINNELNDYLNSPFIADLEAFSVKAVETKNNESRSLINLLNAKKSKLTATLNDKKESYLIDFKKTDLYSLEVFEDCLTVNTNFTQRYNEIRGLKHKIEKIEDEISGLKNKIINQSTECLRDEDNIKSYTFKTEDHRIVIVKSNVVYDFLKEIKKIKRSYLPNFNKIIA